MFAGYAVVRTWNFHIWNNGNDQETGRKSQTFQRNTALINGNTFAFDEQHCKCFPHNIYRDKYTKVLILSSNTKILNSESRDFCRVDKLFEVIFITTLNNNHNLKRFNSMSSIGKANTI